MEKRLFRDETLRLTGIKTVADRECHCGTLTYKPCGYPEKDRDVQEVVYDLMIIAAYDQLKTGQAVYQGDWTAAEMAGKAGCLYQFMENVSDEWEHYSLIAIQTKTFCCSFHPGQTFQTIAEWEGVMNLAPKKYHRFAVEGKELPEDVKIKAYTRCHQPKPSNPYSAAAEEKRINKKFEVLGKVAASLTSEGMRRALSVIAAASWWDKSSYELRDMARKAMDWKLWKDYGKDGNRFPIHFTAKDFEPGPEVWKQVDKAYVEELRKHFQQMLDAAPVPEWPKQGDVVMLKGREKMAKKYQGKFLCEGCVAMLSTYGDRIEWRASVRTKKWDNEYFYPSQLEAAVEPKKPGKKKSKASKPKQAAKASGTNNSQVVTSQSASCYQTTAEPTLAERLREALLKQLKQAA